MGFKTLFKFQEQRPEVYDFKLGWLLNPQDFDFSDNLLSNVWIGDSYTMGDYGRSIDSIKCPNCESVGDIDHGWRVQCRFCHTFMENYGNWLAVWADRTLMIKPGILYGFNYFVGGKKVTKDEYEIIYALRLLETAF